MYTVRKRLEISASHRLSLSYASKCENLHGHNWIVIVWCRSKQLNPYGCRLCPCQANDPGETRS